MIINKMFSKLQEYRSNNYNEDPAVIYVSEESLKELELNHTEVFGYVIEKRPFTFCGIPVKYKRMANDIWCDVKI